MTDEKLVQDFLDGHEQALEKLVEKYLKPIYNFIYQLTRDAGATEDITQDVFVKVWSKLESFDQGKKFSTWLYAIARNAAFDWLKKKKTIPFSVFENEDGYNELENIEDGAVLHSDELLQKMDNVKNAQELLDKLSPQVRTILLLHHKYGFSLLEISEIMEHPTNTIKSKYRRALIFLKKFTSSNSVNKEIAPKTLPAA